MNESGKGSPAKLFWVVILLIVLYAALDILAQSLPRYYSPVRQPESDLAVGTFGFIMTLNFLNRTICVARPNTKIVWLRRERKTAKLQVQNFDPSALLIGG